MTSFLSNLPGMPGRGAPRSHPLLEALRGQTIVHTRVAARGTWTVTARGWVLHSRSQEVEGAPTGAVGLRDPRVVAAAILHAEMTEGRLTLTLRGAHGPLRLCTLPRWRLDGPRGAQLLVEEDGEILARAPGAPRFATDEALAELAASARSGIEERVLALGREQWLHPGHVVDVLAGAGALEDAEFESRGPLLLNRLLVRGEIRAGFVSSGVFTPWDLPLEEVVEHIATTWPAIGGRTPGPDMIAWFALTDAGRAAIGARGARATSPGMSGYDSPGVVGGFR